MEAIKRRIKEIIIKECELDILPDNIGDNDYLLHGGLNMDSIVMVEILVKLEEEFNIYFEDYELTEDNMVSVNVIARLVQKKQIKKDRSNE